jgi:hypothetical protein
MADNVLCEDIDFDFFDSGDDPSTTGKPNDNKHDDEKEEKGKESDMKFSPCGDSVESKNVRNVEQKDGRNETESVQLVSVDFCADVSKKTDKNNLRREVKSSKEDKCMNLRELMNCIAYDESKGKGDEEHHHVFSKLHSLSPDFLSLSTDTTSEITDVTTRSSSSGCSSMSRHETGEHLSEKSHKNAEKKQQKCDKLAESSTGTSMKLLSDALHYFDRQKKKSVTSSILSSNKNRLGKKNMSFSNEQYWKIKRENEILDAKLKVISKQRPKQPSLTASQHRLSSSAINRRKQQAKIDNDNIVSNFIGYISS